MVIYSFCPFRLMHWTSAIWCWLQRELCGKAGSKAAVAEAERSVNNLKMVEASVELVHLKQKPLQSLFSTAAV